MYALIVTNYWADLILLTHTERTYVGAVQREVIFDFSPKMQKVRDSELRQFSLLQVSIRGSLYALVLTNYWADLILLTHTQRAYVGAVRRRVIFYFSPKMPKLRDSELRQFSLFQGSIRGSCTC